MGSVTSLVSSPPSISRIILALLPFTSKWLAKDTKGRSKIADNMDPIEALL